MKIFDERKNKYILATIQLINRIKLGETITLRDFDRELQREASVDESSGLGLDYLRQLKKSCNLFDLHNRDKVGLVIDAPVPVRPSLPEKIWLKSFLNDERMKLFVSEDTIVHLKERLKDTRLPDLHSSIDVRGLLATTDILDDEFIHNFKLILTAIDQNRYLIYSNCSRAGNMYSNKQAIPYKVEYSILQQKLRLSMWSLDEERPVKANIATMFDLAIGEIIEQKTHATVKELVAQKKAPEPIVLRITDRNNTVERSVLFFSQYEYKTRWEEENTLHMELNYYTFDSEEIVSNILSFGPMIVVLGPMDIRRRIFSLISVCLV